MNKLKICRITSSFPPPWEGLAPGPYELSLAQAKSGHDLTVITKYSSGCESLDEAAPFKICRIKVKGNLIFSLLAAIKFIELYLKERYEIVHGHGDTAIALVFIIIKRLFFLKVPVVTAVHIVRKAQCKRIRKADIFKLPREVLGEAVTRILPSTRVDKKIIFFEKIYLKLSDRLAVVSKGLLEDLKTEYGITDKIFVIQNGVNINHFLKGNRDSKMHFKQKLDIDCKYLLFFIGVLNGRKGEFDLIKTMVEVVSENADVNLLIIGNGPTTEIAEKMIKSLHLEKNIKIIPRVKHSEIKMYYMASDLFILPSYSEGLPKVVLEAMACGTPVVASNIPGHREIINHNETGYLFKTGNNSDLALTIINALENVEQRKMISSAAKTRVEEQFSWEAVVKRLEHVYENVLKRRT